MARTPKTPRLHDLDPLKWAEHTVFLMQRYTVRLEALFLVSHPSKLFDAKRGSLLLDLRDLCAWAQHGHPEQRDDARKTALALEDFLYRRPIDGDRDQDEPPFDEQDIVQLVLSAAAGRRKLEAKEPIPGPQLAVLAGIDRSYIRIFVRDGALRRTKVAQTAGRQMDAPIVPSDAQRLLRDRGIAAG